MQQVQYIINNVVELLTMKSRRIQLGGDITRSVINIDLDAFNKIIDDVATFKRTWTESFKLFHPNPTRDKLSHDDKVKSYENYITLKHAISTLLKTSTIDTDVPLFGKDIIERMETIESNHGMVFFDPTGIRQMTLYEHTLDTLFGIVSGTGLSLIDDDYYNKLMIITVIYHDSGKLECDYDHDSISCDIIKSETSLTDDEKDFITDVLIDKNKMFDRYKQIDEMKDDVVQTLDKYDTKYEITKNTAFRIVFSLFLADSTTLFSVYTRFGNKPIFDEYHTSINTLTIDDDLVNILKRFNYRG